MSANLDLVRSIYADWERGDYSSREWAHPEIETVIADGPNPGSWTGPGGMAESMREHLSAWEGAWVKPEDYLELDDERVLVLTRRGGKGRRSGIELGRLRGKGASIFHVRDGKVTRQIHYFDRELALADLGLPSQAGSPRS